MSMRRPYPVDPTVSGMSTTKTQEMLEGENDRMVEEMADKVRALKSLSIDIGDEVKGQNKFLGQMQKRVHRKVALIPASVGQKIPTMMPRITGTTEYEQTDEDFESTGGLLASSMKRVKGMAKAGHNRWMCYMILFIMLVFFVVYYFVRWRTGS